MAQFSKIRNTHTAQRATVLPLANPLLDALCVEDVLFIAVERGHEVVAQEVTPADWTLPPQATHTLIEIVAHLFLLRGLLMLKLRLVERRDNFRHGEWDSEKTAEHAFNEKTLAFLLFGLLNLLLELLK